MKLGRRALFCTETDYTVTNIFQQTLSFLRRPLPRWSLPRAICRLGFQDVPSASRAWEVGHRVGVCFVAAWRVVVFLALAVWAIYFCAYGYMLWLYFTEA